MGQQSSVDWIVRACQNRALKKTRKPADADRDPTSHLCQRVLATDCLFTNEIHVRGRKSKDPSDKRGANNLVNRVTRQ